MPKKSLFPWYKVLMHVFSTLQVLQPKNFMRTTAGRSCGLRGIEELSEIGQSYEDTE